MKTIFKYTLETHDEQDVTLPVGSEILTVKEQYGDICLWALVDPGEAKKEDRRIRILGTGHSFEDDFERTRYLGTVLMSGGSLVWHIFEADL